MELHVGSMPYKLSEIAARFGIYYYPIVSSARAFNALWKRSYRKTADYLGGVVYEDPWLMVVIMVYQIAKILLNLNPISKSKRIEETNERI